MPNETPRIRRLRKDADDMEKEIRQHSNLITYEIKDQIPGMPPERYIVTYHVKSIVGVDAAQEPLYDNEHQLAIFLQESYPRMAPAMRWLTPIWHPNIHHVTKDVCIDVVLWAPSRTLESLIIMIGEMIKWENVHYDRTKPPYPLDAEVADWCQMYAMRKGWTKFPPTDTRELLLPEGIHPGAAESSVPKGLPNISSPPAPRVRLVKRAEEGTVPMAKAAPAELTPAATPAPPTPRVRVTLHKTDVSSDSAAAESPIPKRTLITFKK